MTAKPQELTKQELAMYFVVNSDLKMGKGKTAAQVAHVMCDLAEQYLKPSPSLDPKLYHEWKESFQRKIVLRAPEKKLLELIAKYPKCSFIHDAGLTQVEAGSLTAIGFPVMQKGENPDLAILKLLP